MLFSFGHLPNSRNTADLSEVLLSLVRESSHVSLNGHNHHILGCGLSTLEVAANSYISVLGTPQYAAARLNFSQGFQGVASFSGPLIAARWFFTGANATSLGTVQWCVPHIHPTQSELIQTYRVYLAVAGLGIVLNALF